jgi:hypothetical protein
VLLNTWRFGANAPCARRPDPTLFCPRAALLQLRRLRCRRAARVAHPSAQSTPRGSASHRNRARISRAWSSCSCLARRAASQIGRGWCPRPTPCASFLVRALHEARWSGATNPRGVDSALVVRPAQLGDNGAGEVAAEQYEGKTGSGPIFVHTARSRRGAPKHHVLSGTSVYPCRPDDVTFGLSVCWQWERANDLTKVRSTAFGNCEVEDARATVWLPISTGQGDADRGDGG